MGQVEQVGQFSRAQLGPIGNRACLAVADELGQHAEHQEDGKWVAHATPLAAIGQGLELAAGAT
jgi:hypothetical protein